MKKILFVLILCSVSYYTKANDATSTWTTVKYIYSGTASGSPYIQFEKNSMPGCYGNSGAYLQTDDPEGVQRTFSILLAASMSGKKVRAYYNYGNNPEGYDGWGLCTIEAVYFEI